MYGTRGRFILIAMALGLGILQLRAGSALGWLTLAAVPLLVWGQFRHGTVFAAYRAYRKGDYARLHALLAQVSRPELLRAQDRAYYDFLLGVDAQRQGDLPTARDAFQAALQGPLRTRNMVGVVHLHLARVALDAGDSAAARTHVESARQYAHRDSTLDDVARVEAALRP
jgi:uncharacterized membrane-anchored protein